MRMIGGLAALALVVYAVAWTFDANEPTFQAGLTAGDGQIVLLPGNLSGDAEQFRVDLGGFDRSRKGFGKPKRPRPRQTTTTITLIPTTSAVPTTSTPTTAPSPTSSAPATTVTTNPGPTTTNPGPSPTAPPTTASPTTSAPSGAPAGAIVLDPSKNVASVVASAPAGASFYFTAGTYRRVTINPKDNQVFIAASGVVFDGENATKAAFIPSGSTASSNVVINGFEIKNYTPVEQYGWNEGAITSKWYESQGGGSGWVVENVNVHHNRGAGILLTNLGVVRNSSIHHNYAMGVKLYWAPSGGLIEGNSIYSNNFDGAPDFNETGGTKFAWTTNLVVRNNHVFDNSGPGLWTDIDNYNTTYTGNLLEDNAGPGLVHEISHSTTIQSNVVTGNGHGSQGWMWGAGILIANSDKATISGNTLAGNQSGIGIIQQSRGSYQATGITVLNNSVTGPGMTGAVQDIGNANFFNGKVSFSEQHVLEHDLRLWLRRAVVGPVAIARTQLRTTLGDRNVRSPN